MLEAWRLYLMQLKCSPRSKVVGFVISSHLNIESAKLSGSSLSGDIFPGLDRVAAGSGCSRRAAAGGIAELKTKGVMTWRRRSHNSNLYTLMIPGDVQASAHSDVQEVAQQRAADVQNPAHHKESDVQFPDPLCAGLGSVMCSPVHANLGSNPINPSDAFFEKLKGEIGNKNWNSQLFEGAEFVAPNTILFASQKQRQLADGRYSRAFDRRGLIRKERKAA